jgi:hypothetical protein
MAIKVAVAKVSEVRGTLISCSPDKSDYERSFFGHCMVIIIENLTIVLLSHSLDHALISHTDAHLIHNCHMFQCPHYF